MNIVRIDQISDRRVAVYASLTDTQLQRSDVMVVESPKVILTALSQGFKPLSLLCEEKRIEGDAARVIEACRGITVYTGDRTMLRDLTGYTLTRGVLCAMQRPETPSPHDVCRNAARVAVIDMVCDTTNIGSIFRSAAALGIDAVLLTRGTCDPYNRRSIRVSMGSVFLVPWAWIDDPVEDCKALGLTTLAMALRDDALSLDDDSLRRIPRCAIILGTEGDGLSARVIDGVDKVVTIPMRHGVDSLNVGAAAAVAFWQLRLP